MEGEHGPGARLAMSIIVRMAGVFRANRLIDIEGAHIDSALYMGDATLEFAERLAGLGAKVAVPSTLNVSGVDEYGWGEWDVPPDWAAKAHRQMQAYREMGCIPTWTCAPYQTDYRPKFGQQIAWGESNAIAFANSVIGARTARYPDLLDICAAITGRVPAASYHLDENRAGEILFHLGGIPEQVQEQDLFYPVLGHLMGRLAGDQVPVVDGVTVQPTEDRLKAMCAAIASSGTVGMFHIVGVTPEAPTVRAALQGREPTRIHSITLQDLNAARGELTTSTGQELDMIVLGSPHFSLEEFKALSPLVRGRRKHDRVRFLVTSSRALAALAERAGLLDTLRDFGGTITLDTCILTTPMLPPEIQTIMTNSAKYAYYAPGMLNTRVVFGSLEDCVRSAIAGRVEIEERAWRA
jgi:predicted aconitase